MKKLSITWPFFALVIALPVTVFAFVHWYEAGYTAVPVLGPEGHTTGTFSMQDQRGETITESNTRGKIVVTNFFFTHCPLVCVKMTMNLRKVADALTKEGVVTNSFTVDPERDSVKQMAGYAARFKIDGNWNLLTGNKTAIYRLARKSFFVVATDGDGGAEDFIHSDKLVLTDKRGRIRGYYNGTDAAEVANMMNDISKIKHE